jgi:exodeoxyribonuclease-3
MKLATWNVNSIKIRAPAAAAWLTEHAPDVLLMQELKCETAAFPAEAFRAAGYEHISAVGQKSYNGVAVVSKRKFDVLHEALPGDAGDAQARYQEVCINGLHIINIYAPNGNPLGTEKFPYKLAWLARLQARLEILTRENKSFIVMGDFNIIPEDRDCYDAAAWMGDALFQPESRAAYRRMINLGLTDAIRMFAPTEHLYTFWDYQAGAWQRNHGIRIDHILMSPAAADRCIAAGIDKSPRGREQPSDHVPVWVQLR